MVHADLVPKHKIIPGEATTVKCIHGDNNILYPMADVVVQVEGVKLAEGEGGGLRGATSVSPAGDRCASITLHTPGFLSVNSSPPEPSRSDRRK